MNLTKKNYRTINHVLENGLELFYGETLKHLTKKYKKDEDDDLFDRCDFDNYLSIWSGVSDILRSVELLKVNNKILDIGSGNGKYCVIGALLYPDIQFVGIELSKRRVDISNLFKKHLKLDNVTFIHSDFCDVYTEFSDVKSVYTFNPFDMGVYLKMVENKTDNLMKKYQDTLNKYLSSLEKGSLFYSNNITQRYPSSFRIKKDIDGDTGLFVKRK
jgi:SAM-dependent methyltransferase